MKRRGSAHRFLRGGPGAASGGGTVRGGAVCGAGWAVCGGRLKGPSLLEGRGDTPCVSAPPPQPLAPWSSKAAASRPEP